MFNVSEEMTVKARQRHARTLMGLFIGAVASGAFATVNAQTQTLQRGQTAGPRFMVPTFRSSERGLGLQAAEAVRERMGQDFQLKTRVYNFLAGPEFKARNSTRFTPFAHVLGGVAHTSATFTTPGPTHILFLRTIDTSFAMALGGGLDIRASKRVSFRALMDYNPVFVRDSTTGTRDLFRLSLGVLFH